MSVIERTVWGVSIVAMFSMLSAVNSERDAPVAPHDELTVLAADHAEAMADNGGIFHSDSIPGSVTGENVGVGFTLDAVQDAFVASDPHYTVMTDPRFASVGIGVHESDDRVWVVQIYSNIDSTHGEAILWVLDEGLMGGYPDGTFRSNEPVTRGQLATVLKNLDDAERR